MTGYQSDTNVPPPGSSKTNCKQECFYPSCHSSAIKFPDSYVAWEIYVPLQTIYDMFPPVVKLAIQENSTNKKDIPKAMTIYIHPECAAEWGMHLIKDALEAKPQTGRKLRRDCGAPKKVEYEF